MSNYFGNTVGMYSVCDNCDKVTNLTCDGNSLSFGVCFLHLKKLLGLLEAQEFSPFLKTEKVSKFLRIFIGNDLET